MNLTTSCALFSSSETLKAKIQRIKHLASVGENITAEEKQSANICVCDFCSHHLRTGRSLGHRLVQR